LEYHDGRNPDYDIRERFPDDRIHPDDLPRRLSQSDHWSSDDEPCPCVIDVGSDEIFTISDDDDVIIESMPDIIEIVEVKPDTAGPSKQPVCLKLQKTQHEKKILLKEEPKRIVKRPYNLGDKCKLTGKQQEGNSMKKKRKVELECEGRNIVKTYEETPCASTSRANEEEEPDVVEVQNARRQKGIAKKSKKTCPPCQPSTSGRGNARQQKGDKSNLKPRKKEKTDVNNNSGIDVAAVATNLATNLQNLIRPSLRNTVLTLEVLAMTKRIFDNCAKIRLPKRDRKKRFGFLPFIIPPLVGVTVLAAESAAQSGEIHCPRGYQKFGKKCIRKGVCPNGYLEILDFDIFQGLRKLPKGGGAKTDL
jgi:hypothetical protein